ncbi:MAG: 4-alpha-glucanotransferase [Gemmatimonadota bacterium]
MGESTQRGREGRELRELARLYGVQTSYEDVTGHRRSALPEVLLAVLKAQGAPLDRIEEAADAGRARRLELCGRAVSPTVVVWGGRGAEVRLRGPAGRSGLLELRLELESGENIEWCERWEALAPAGGAVVEGSVFEARRLLLPAGLPCGYHRLVVGVGGGIHRALVLSAPERAWLNAGGTRRWGIFLPLYALRSARSWATGSFTDLAELARWTASRGGSLIGTLPMLAAFLDLPLEPSPYLPASRLLWNDLYIDLEGSPELAACPEARTLLADPATRAEVAALRDATLVDYRRAAVLHRRILGALSLCFFAEGRHHSPAFRSFLEEVPEASDYARFRAAGERYRAPWRAWPERQRAGDLRRGDYDEEAARRHLYAQWLASAQLSAAAETARSAGAVLYLDLPLGIHPDGYDVWRERRLYAEGVAAGAPPDPFFEGGQVWGFPPFLPGRLREAGYGHYRRILRAHMRVAGVLRIDHVMGLHRLFWIPRGAPAREGVYVRYPARELYAILCIESRRHACTVVGEDLGTVPQPVRAAMDRRGILRSYVLAFGLPGREGDEPAAVPEDSLATLNTHDLYPFAAFWEGRDLEDRRRLFGDSSATDFGAALEKRRVARAALAAYLERHGRLGAPATASRALLACLAHLAASPARYVLVSLEDLWGEVEPHNVPGTLDERPNWRRRARLTLHELAEDRRVTALLAALRRGRRAAAAGAAPARGGGGG